MRATLLALALAFGVAWQAAGASSMINALPDQPVAVGTDVLAGETLVGGSWRSRHFDASTLRTYFGGSVTDGLTNLYATNLWVYSIYYRGTSDLNFTGVGGKTNLTVRYAGDGIYTPLLSTPEWSYDAGQIYYWPSEEKWFVDGGSIVLMPGNRYIGDGSGLTNLPGVTVTPVETNFYFFTTNVFVDNTYVSNSFATNYYLDTYVSNFFQTNLYSTNLYQDYFTTNVYQTDAYVSNYFTTNVFNDTYNSNFFTTNVYNSYITNITYAVSNFYSTNITAVNNYSSNAYITNITARNLTVNNIIYDSSNPMTNVWAGGPTGTVDLALSEQYYAASADMSITGFTSKSNNISQSVLLNILASGANRTIYLPNGVAGGDGESSYICTNGVLRVISLRYTPALGGHTNAVGRSFWR